MEKYIENETSVEKGKRFNDLVIKSQFPLDFSKFTYTDGSGDGGIDSFWVTEGRECNYVVIVQSKYGTSFQGCDTIRSEVGKLWSTLRDESFTGNYGSHLKIRSCLGNDEKKTSLTYIFASSEEFTEDEKDCLYEETERLNSLGFYEIKSLSIAINDINSKINFNSSPITFKLESIISLPGSEKYYRGFIKAKELYNSIKYISDTFGDKDLVFSRNVRSDLGGRAKVNRDIEDTMENHPEDLLKSNLGITITTRYPITNLGNNCFNIISPSIVNGAQTSSCLIRAFDKIIKKLGENSLPDNCYIPCDIIVSESEEEEREITNRRNTSTKVNKSATFATKGIKFYKKIKDMMTSKYGVRYDINLKAQSMKGKTGSHDLMSTAGAILGLIGEAVTPTHLMPDESCPGKLGYLLGEKLINEEHFSKLCVYIANNYSVRLQNWVYLGKRISNSRNGWGRTFTLMLVVSRIIMIFGNKSTFINDYIQGISKNPGPKVNVPEDLSEITIKLLEDQETQDFITETIDDIWGTYAIDPMTIDSYLRQDYLNRFTNGKGNMVKDDSILRSLDGSNCKNLYVLLSTRINDLIKSNPKISKKLKSIINS